MEIQSFSKASMADAMNTSRSALDRLLDLENIAVTSKPWIVQPSDDPRWL